MVNQLYPVNYLNETGVALRPLPYPYRAMLAICSDLDETSNLDTYLEISRFLNTTENTKMGPGVGLEVGNSIYFDMPSDQFSYWNTSEKGRDIIRTLIQSGHIDCLHSYGDLAMERKDAERALNELDRNNCYLRVWVDHGQAPTNLGADIMCGRGDVPGDAAYHADLTIPFGIKYVWLGRVTSVVGQETRRKLWGIWTLKHPMVSFRALGKEFVKGVLARMGSAKYAMHLPNRIMAKRTLRDGQTVTEFIRSTFHWGGISYDDTAQGMASVLTQNKLDLLVKRRGVAIIYTHLGKLGRSLRYSSSTVNAFRLLKQYQEQEKILVTTTSRLLNYIHIAQSLTWKHQTKTGYTIIDITTDRQMHELSGITFHLPEQKEVIFMINGKKIENIHVNPKDESGKYSVTIPWKNLEFPHL